MKELYLKGTITLDEQDQSRMNYILTSCQGEQTSITDLLDTIYNSKNCIKKLVRVVGKICCNGHNFHCFEGLHIQNNKKGISGYFVGNFPVGDQLFELVGEECEIYIEDYTDSICITEDVQHGRITKTVM
jgi:hypothetical protein